MSEHLSPQLDSSDPFYEEDSFIRDHVEVEYDDDGNKFKLLDDEALVGFKDIDLNDPIVRLTMSAVIEGVKLREAESNVSKLRADMEALRTSVNTDKIVPSVFSRFALDEIKTRLVEEANDPDAMKGKKIIAVYADMVGFKSVNDTYGHPVGDATLAAFGQKMTDSVKGDAVIRMGGDEFAALMVVDAEDPNVQDKILDRLDRNVRITGVTHNEKDYDVDVIGRWGVAEVSPDGNVTEAAIQDAIDRADEMSNKAVAHTVR